jgi:hypothetical protein
MLWTSLDRRLQLTKNPELEGSPGATRKSAIEPMPNDSVRELVTMG